MAKRQRREEESTAMKPVLKRQQCDMVLWMLVIAAFCLVGLLIYFVWHTLAQPQMNGTLVMAREFLGKRGGA